MPHGLTAACHVCCTLCMMVYSLFLALGQSSVGQFQRSYMGSLYIPEFLILLNRGGGSYTCHDCFRQKDMAITQPKRHTALQVETIYPLSMARGAAAWLDVTPRGVEPFQGL